jgi:hypothetical protein
MKITGEKLHYQLLSFANFFEKVKNIIVWKDKNRSILAITCLVIPWIFLSHLPIRYLGLLACK